MLETVLSLIYLKLQTVEEGDGVCADGIQSHHLFAVFGAAAFVFLFPPEEGPARRGRKGFTGVFLHVSDAVSAVKLLVHPSAGTHVNDRTGKQVSFQNTTREDRFTDVKGVL